MEGRHGERESCGERRPDPVHDLLEVPDERSHRQHGLHQQAVLPLPTLAPCEVAGLPRRGMAGQLTQDNHALLTLAHEPRQGGIRDLGGGPRPCHH